MRHTPYIYIYIRLYYYVRGLCISPPIYISEHLQVGKLQDLNPCQWPIDRSRRKTAHFHSLCIVLCSPTEFVTAIKLSELTSVCSCTLYTLI